MEGNNLIDQYLITRGLWKPVSGIRAGEENDILANEEKLAKVAGLFNSFGDALAWAIEEKIKKMALDLIREADPREVIIIRQAMVEVSSLWDDLETYSEEYKKRRAPAESALNNEDNAEAVDNEPPN